MHRRWAVLDLEVVKNPGKHAPTAAAFCQIRRGDFSYPFPHKLGGGKFCVYTRNWVKPTHTIGPSQHSFPRMWGSEKALARFLEARWRNARAKE